MKDKDFDQQISRLYQERKAHYHAPQINLNINTKTSWWQKLVIILMGSCASLGVLALMQHWSNATPQQDIEIPTSTVTIVELETKTESQIAEVSQPYRPMPPPKIQTLPKSNQVQPESLGVQAPDGMQLSITTMIDTPQPNISEPDVKLLPYYRESPKYIQKPYEDSEGSVKLQYLVSPLGKVTEVKIIESSVGRSLQRSSIAALKAWKYPENSGTKQPLTVQFEFSLEK